MTIESGGRPVGGHESGSRPLRKISQPASGAWATHRTLDPIRGAALTAAVRLVSGHGDLWTADPASVLIIAKEFERYLTGEEANG
jgi:hypothetical protein